MLFDPNLDTYLIRYKRIYPNHGVQSEIMEKLKYLSSFYRRHLSITQQLLLGSFHRDLNYSTKKWRKHILCTGLTVVDHNPIAARKLTTHTDSRYKHHYIDDIVTQGIGTHRVMGNRKPIKDKEIEYYVDRYCTSCGSLLIRRSPDTLVCLSCGKRYKT